MDGNWGQWSEWASCSNGCGSGTTTRTRECNDPAPSNGGSDCTGSSTDSATCESLDGDGCVPDTDCWFDKDCAGWDFGGWTINQGGTRSGNTGPTKDKSSEFMSFLGEYIYKHAIALNIDIEI